MKTRFKWPAIVVQHGRVIELKVDIGDDRIARFRWPKSRGDVRCLLTDGAGKRLLIVREIKVSVTDADFLERIEAGGKPAYQAIEQWRASTGRAPDVGSIMKVPERQIEKIGRAVSITYFFDKKFSDGSPREHVFRDYPAVTVKADNTTNPNLIVISGGDLTVTRAGIEG